MNELRLDHDWRTDARPAPAVACALPPLWAPPLDISHMIAGKDRAAMDAGPSAWILAIARIRCRDSFALLFNRFAPRVKGYLLKLGCRPEQAEELAQETLLQVWRKADYYDPARAGASTWIFTIARNLRIDAVRRERHPEDLEHEPGLKPEHPAAADDLVSTAERDERLRVAMQSLSADQAEVVQLSFFQDKAHSEISKDLGLPLGTVKSRLRLAMMRLRAQMEDLL